jgi:hypothetical protein
MGGSRKETHLGTKECLGKNKVSVMKKGKGELQFFKRTLTRMVIITNLRIQSQ